MARHKDFSLHQQRVGRLSAWESMSRKGSEVEIWIILVLEVKEFPVNKTNKGPFELAGKLEKGI